VLVEGIEFCDVLVMNKTDMVPDDVLDEIESVAERLGPGAKRIRTSYPRSTLTRCSTPDGSTSRRPRGRRGGSARLRKARANTVTSQQPASTNTITPRAPPRGHGVDSFVYRSADALDPESFANWLHDWDGAIVRAKGVANVAGTDEVIGVSQAGPSVQAGPIGEWGPDDDRRTRLVFIGSEMDEARIRGELDELAASNPESVENADAFPL